MVSISRKNILTLSITLLTALFSASFGFINETHAGEIVTENTAGKFGVIKGVVKDNSGKPIANATVAVFRAGTTELLKQVTATKSGRFFARVIPGTYTILAVAQGFNPVTLRKVEVENTAELVYGFNLEKAGNGNTLPEKRADRNSAKWAIRAARRSIYQANEDDKPIISDAETAETAVEKEENQNARKGQTVVETFAASGKNGNFGGVNFATLRPVGQDSEIIFAGQTGTGKSAPQRFETTFSFRPNENHKVSVKSSIANLGDIKINEQSLETLGQISFQALDQWKVREGVVVVFGLDYSRFIGAGNDYSISPRLGLQYDVNAKTRLRTAYTTQTEDRTWQKVIDLEGTQVLFREPVAIDDIVVEEGNPQMNKSTRFEFGIERILDNNSTIEANMFFDTAMGRGVGLINLPFDTLSENGFESLTGNQQGRTQGVRLVYNRHLNSTFSTAAGYAFGGGQKISTEAISSPSKMFENGMFQTFFGEVNADLKTGTSIKTLFRFSPQATVFAIDPFQGKLAIYDPGLSIMITQDLPSWGLPIDAEAMFNARNIFDQQSGVSNGKGTLNLTNQNRMLRGGILVRF